MDKQNVTYPYNGVISMKSRVTETSHDMDEPQKYCQRGQT